MREKAVATYRIGFATLVAAVFAIDLTWWFSRSDFTIWNYLSYFTNESNMIGAAAFLVTAAALLKTDLPRRDRLRGAAAVYLLTTGIVYQTMLSNVQIDDFGPQLANLVFHRVMPIVVLFDWFIDPPRDRMFDRRVLVWLIFPLGYLAYTLLRGPLVGGWYPYPFLDPAGGGYANVVIGASTVAAVILGLSALIAWTGDLAGRRWRAALPAPAGEPAPSPAESGG